MKTRFAITATLAACVVAMSAASAAGYQHKAPFIASPHADTAVGDGSAAGYRHKAPVTFVHQVDAHAQLGLHGEPAKLRAKAEQHRKLAQLYRGRTPPKGVASFDPVAKHCEQTAARYDTAALAAEARLAAGN